VEGAILKASDCALDEASVTYQTTEMQTSIFIPILAEEVTDTQTMPYGWLACPGILLFGVILLAFISIPIWIAVKRNHPQKGPIIALTIIGGWTAIGWIIALIWSLSTPRPPTVINQTFAPPAPVPLPPQTEKESIEQQLRSLASLKADGLMSEEEFQEKRSVLMAKL